QGPLHIKFIAETQGIPQNYLEQLLVKLKKAQIVKSYRGAQREIEADRIIIATGSKSATLPFFDFEQPNVLNSTKALELKEVPESILIVGAGIIGSEFASIFNALGTQITMVEMMDQILPGEDPRIARQMQQIFRKGGINIFTKTTIEGITNNKHSNNIIAKLDNGEKVHTEKLLVSIGREPNSKFLGLEDIGIKLDQKGNIIVNERMETNIEGVYAVGDVIGGILLAHVASAEGIIASENAVGFNSRIDYTLVPNTIYTHPQIASVGLTADKAKLIGRKVKLGRFPFSANSKAKILKEKAGFVQIVVDEETDKVLGAQIIGSYATELIHELVLIIKFGITAEEVSNTIHAHPTLAESIREAALSIHGRAIHSV
ncbi:MAG: FAD-dependent oxidoreductase, partial [Thermodesulfobacteriota bacterium]|nr:FAD-dependent oxidoreductase [Thermodesulfobacteriota bacterium]